MRPPRWLVPACAWFGLVVVGAWAMCWYASPLTSVLLADAWLLCVSK